jgi:hypothetical protein
MPAHALARQWTVTAGQASRASRYGRHYVPSVAPCYQPTATARRLVCPTVRQALPPTGRSAVASTPVTFRSCRGGGRGEDASFPRLDRLLGRPPATGRGGGGCAFGACCFAGKLRSPAGLVRVLPWPRPSTPTLVGTRVPTRAGGVPHPSPLVRICPAQSPWGTRSRLVTPPAHIRGSVHRGCHGDAADQGPAPSLRHHSLTAGACPGQGCGAVGAGCSGRRSRRAREPAAGSRRSAAGPGTRGGPSRPNARRWRGVRRPNRRADDRHIGCAPDIIERSRELGVPVADQNPERPGLVVKHGDKVAGLLDNPRSGRVGGDASKTHPPAPEFDDEQHIQPLQEHRIDREGVTRQDASRLAAQERSPCRRSTSRRWVDAVGSQHPADRAG